MRTIYVLGDNTIPLLELKVFWLMSLATKYKLSVPIALGYRVKPSRPLFLGTYLYGLGILTKASGMTLGEFSELGSVQGALFQMSCFLSDYANVESLIAPHARLCKAVCKLNSISATSSRKDSKACAPNTEPFQWSLAVVSQLGVQQIRNLSDGTLIRQNAIALVLNIE